MKVGFVQNNPVIGEKTKNLERVSELVQKGNNADLLVLPEMFATGYWVKNKQELSEYVEPVPGGETTELLSHLAKEKNMHLVAGLPEEEKGKYYITSVLVGPEGLVGKYRKLQLYSEEKDWFEPGNLPLQVYDIGKARVGMTVCWDYVYPEIYRTLAIQGADLITNISNLELFYCMKVMAVRAMENRVFTVSVNRVGKERGRVFHGGSQIVDPSMNVLAEAGEDEEVRVVEIDASKARKKKVRDNDLFEDRRLEFYNLEKKP
jgi:predicted amidohydrolase